MPQTVIFLEDLGLAEKGIAEMLAPVSIRRLTLCFSIVRKTRDSPAFMVVTVACMGSPGTRHWVEALAAGPLGTGDSVPSNVFPDKWNRDPEVVFSGGHSLLKWPACLH
jgi:hypothetical protein